MWGRILAAAGGGTLPITRPERWRFVTQPETGTATNTVGTDPLANDYGLLKTKVDAKGQKVEYVYDAYKRVTEVKRYKVQTDTTPDACQGTKYQYDVNTWDTAFANGNPVSPYLSGRMAGVEYHVCTYNPDGSLEKDRTIREMYRYSIGGRPLKKRMQLQRTDPLGGSGTARRSPGLRTSTRSILGVRRARCCR